MSREQAVRPDEHVVVVSADGHVGPRLVEDLRPYCPREHLDSYDEMAGRHQTARAARAELAAQAARRRKAGDSMEGVAASFNARITNDGPGHHDPSVRLAHMDGDGVAAEFFYHFSQNGEPLPWISDPLGPPPSVDHAMAEVSYSIYNRWLADFCSLAPERLLGLMYLPYWDLELSVEMMTWARDHGLRGASFPPPGREGVEPFNSLAWEPFWSAAEDLGVSLHTHASGAPMVDYFAGPGGRRIMFHEITGYMSRRATWWLVLGEVFERHPNLRLVQTEQSEGWYLATAHEMDSMYLSLTRAMDTELPRLPSEYLRQCVFAGASFVSQAEVLSASRDGWADNLIWGRDYPHAEGTYRQLDDPDAEPYTKRALRHVFSSVPAGDAVKMAGINAVRALGLDGDHLTLVAREIGALTVAELGRPLEEVPHVDSYAFVGYGGARAVEPQRLEWSNWAAPLRRAEELSSQP
jgi:predicted TIM-barrel fold metal-dependent hydrolase